LESPSSSAWSPLAVLVAQRSARLWLALTLNGGPNHCLGSRSFIAAIKMGWRF
jgi:hypothetical protein